MKTICDLPLELVGEKILSKLPITSLGQVRSTCKLWDRLTREWILGKEAATRQQQQQDQFLGFVTVDFKVCSLRFNRKEKEKEEGFHLSVKPVGGLLNQFEIGIAFHCEGLLLCLLKDDHSKLLAWNPYLGQTRWITLPTTKDDSHSHRLITYLFGYDTNRNHKILTSSGFVFEMYEFSTDSWRVLEVDTQDWSMGYGYHTYVSLKGNAYFRAQEYPDDDSCNDFILCFDFTTETFGEPLLFPFLLNGEEAATLSSFRDEKLALLHQKGPEIIEVLEIWITPKIDEKGIHDGVTWSKFMNVDMRPLIGDRYVRFGEDLATFFIIGDEEGEEKEKIAVVFDMEGYEFCFELVRTDHYHTAFIIGDKGYYKTVSLGLAPNLYKPDPGHTGDYVPQFYQPPHVTSSSYLPSLVQLNQLNQPRKRKERDE